MEGIVLLKLFILFRDVSVADREQILHLMGVIGAVFGAQTCPRENDPNPALYKSITL
jgi:hypothetical protein